MAENIIESTPTEPVVDQSQVDAKAELDQQMSIALNGGRLPQTQQAVEPIVDTTIITPSTETIEPIVTEPTSPSFTFDTFKEKYAYATPEDVIKDIEAYQKFKANPVADIEFENEESRKFFEAVKSGKLDVAVDIQLKQNELASLTSEPVTKDNAEKIIKANMKFKYGLDTELIDRRFSKQFPIPKQPKFDAVNEDETEFEVRLNEWKEEVANIEKDKIIEANIVKPELESYKAKLILPDIEADIDEDYVNWKQSQEQSLKIDAETVEAYKAFTPKSIETKLNFNDEANKVAFEFQYEPTVEELAKSVEMVTDIKKFYGKFIGQDGKPDRQGFLRAIHFAVNADSMLLEAMKQSKNATIKSRLPDNRVTDSNGGIVRQLPQGQQMSELDTYMQAAGIKR